MRSFKYLLIGILGIASMVGVVMVVPPTDMEAATGTALFGSVNIGDGSGKCEVPPAWTGPIRGKARWVPTYIDKHGKPHAYCDRQTGIVIQRTPGTPGQNTSPCDNGNSCTWPQARFYCARLNVGETGQKGWRLLAMPELAALVDTNSNSCTDDNLCLPDDHPFKEVQSAVYWSASTLADAATNAWFVNFSDGLVDGGGKNNSLGRHAWCGRGPSTADAY